MSDNILQMAKSFKDMTELQAYCDSQYKTIIELSKKINKLEQQNKDLEKLVESKGLISEVSSTLSVDASDEEVICTAQLKLLRDISNKGAFTLEESRKFEIFTKILQTIQANKKKTGEGLGKLNDDELLSMIEKKS